MKTFCIRFLLIVFSGAALSSHAFSQILQKDTIFVPLIKKATEKGYLTQIIEPERNDSIDKALIHKPLSGVSYAYFSIQSALYNHSTRKLEAKDILFAIATDPQQSVKYVIVDTDIDGKLTDETIHTFHARDNVNDLAYWEKNSPVIMLPYVVMDGKIPVQKHAAYRLIPWDKFNPDGTSGRAWMRVILRSLNHYESYPDEKSTLFVVNHYGASLGIRQPFFQVLSADTDVQNLKWIEQGDMITHNMGHYKISALKEGAMDYLVLTKATAEDLDTARKPFYPGNKPADMKIKTSDGLELALKDFRGKYLLLNFWGTWCKPCHEMMPALEKLHRVVDSERLAMVGIACEQKDGNPLDYIRANGIHWPQTIEFFGPDITGGLMRTAQIKSFPALILLNDQGIVVERPSNKAEMERLIDRLTEQFGNKK